MRHCVNAFAWKLVAMNLVSIQRHMNTWISLKNSLDEIGFLPCNHYNMLSRPSDHVIRPSFETLDFCRRRYKQWVNAYTISLIFYILYIPSFLWWLKVIVCTKERFLIFCHTWQNRVLSVRIIIILQTMVRFYEIIVVHGKMTRDGFQAMSKS